MKGYSYRDRDYAFGQTILTLRTKIGLTQTELADVLGVTRRAVGDWEGGLTYPKAEHLKQFVVLAIEQQAFPAGREAEEVHALWQAARQKVLLDEAWLGTLLPQSTRPLSRPFMVASGN
jgi:transcriptional regulator with XRE-family HTH domain